MWAGTFLSIIPVNNLAFVTPDEKEKKDGILLLQSIRWERNVNVITKNVKNL